MSSKINLQTCEYACKSSIFQDNQLIYIENEESFIYEDYTREELNDDIKKFFGQNVKIEEANYCYVSVLYTDIDGNQSLVEYAYDDGDYDYEEFEDYDEYMEYCSIPICTYKLNGRWYAMLEY